MSSTIQYLSKTSSRWGGTLFRSGWLWLSVMVLCGATYGPTLTYEQFRDTKRKISDLPLEDRERLERNLAYYESLPPAKQKEYWELHEYVKNHEMQPLIDDYLEWLQTLTPFQRNQLRSSPEAAAQIATVEAILQQKDQTHEQLLPELLGRIFAKGDPRFSFLQFVLNPEFSINKSDPFLLTDAQLDLIINQIIYGQLPPTQRDEIDQLNVTDYERKYRIMAASIAVSKNLGVEWPSQRTHELIKEQVKVDFQKDQKDGIGAFVRFRLSNNWENYRRMAFRSLVVRSLVVSEMRSFEREHNYTNNDLTSYFSLLEGSQQAAILNSPADYQAEALKWLYLWDAHQKEATFARPDMMRAGLSDFFPRGGRPGGGGGGGGGGDRRPPNGDGKRPFGNRDNREKSERE